MCLFFVCLCFLFVFLCVCVGCSTCYVLILSQIISACSMSSEIHHLQLKFASFRFFFLTVDEHLDNPTIISLSRFGEFQKQSG